MKIIFILFFLVSCASPNPNIKLDNTKLIFNDDLSFEDFNKLLIEYAEVSDYQNIDK